MCDGYGLKYTDQDSADSINSNDRSSLATWQVAWMRKLKAQETICELHTFRRSDDGGVTKISGLHIAYKIV